MAKTTHVVYIDEPIDGALPEAIAAIIEQLRSSPEVEGPPPEPMPKELMPSHAGKCTPMYSGMSEIALGYHLYKCGVEGCPVRQIEPCASRWFSYTDYCMICESLSYYKRAKV